MSIIRELSAAAITDAVEQLCIEANTQLPADVKAALDKAEANEPWPLAKDPSRLRMRMSKPSRSTRSMKRVETSGEMGVSA